ncbi:MAG: hypothetical protein DWQ07_14175 [Chloroflexi bacterium]|nr:MAG: hypothetical protein DWQ07_14175 [Chloroflexota bacterium]
MLAFELSAKVGEENPYALLQRMPSSLWDEWRAFNAMSPLGGRRLDVLFARLGAQLIRAILAPWNRSGVDITPTDLLADWDGSRQSKAQENIPGRNPVQMLEKITAWASHLGARIINKGTDDSS